MALAVVSGPVLGLQTRLGFAYKVPVPVDPKPVMSARVWVAVWLGAMLLLNGWGAETVQDHRFRFFIHPDLAAGLSRADLHRRLALYVADVNTLFARQTIRRFVFDPASDVTVTNGTPYSGHCGGCADADYEVWAHVLPSNIPALGSYGGFMAFDDSCAGVVADLHWDAVYDRAALEPKSGTSAWLQYCLQLHHLMHELEHIFGAGIGEYYSLLRVSDPTPESPRVPIDYTAPGDPFWSRHAEYLADPLTLFTADLTYSNLMARVRFADVTAAVINARVRWSLNDTLPDLSRTRILVHRAETGTPVASARVKVWRVQSFPPYAGELVLDALTDAAGRVPFDWQAGFNNYEHLILVKVSHPDARAPAARWVSLYDAQEAKMVRNEADFEVPVLLSGLPWLSLQVSGETAVIRWPVASANVVLQSCSDLFANDWTAVTGREVLPGDEDSARVPLSGARRFFRLVAPP